MDRVLSRVVNGQLVEYAGGGGFGPSASEQRERCRNAPAWWRSSLDRSRQLRGLSPLWPELRHEAAATPTGVARSRLTSMPAWRLVGCVTPGTSEPVIAATDGLRLPERFAPSAFAKSLRSFKDYPVTLQIDHGGPVIASTEGGTLALTVDPVVGLVIEGRVANVPQYQRLVNEAACGEVGLSVSCVPYRVTFETINGKRHRVIHEAGLRHVALIRKKTGGRPAYRSRVRVMPWDKSSDVGRLQAVLDGLRIACQQDGLI